MFRREIQASKTELVSRATGVDGGPAFANSSHPSISGDGRFVAFESAAGNLSDEDNAGADIFVRNMEASTTTLVSRKSGAAGEAADGSSYAPVFPVTAGSSSSPPTPRTSQTLDDDAAPVRDVFVRQLAVTPPPPDTGPDLGSNDHSGHEGHDPSSPDHAGHTAAEHANHVTASGRRRR